MSQVNIFFSAHGVPVAYVEEAGDPYKAEMEECVELITDELKLRGVNSKHTLAYQVRKEYFVDQRIAMPSLQVGLNYY